MALIQDPDNGNIAKIEASGRLRIIQPSSAEEAGFTRIADGNGNPILTTEDGSLATSSSALVLYEQVDGNNLNTNLWVISSGSMTINQNGGFINLNAASSVATNGYATLNSIKSVPLYGFLPVRFSFNAKVSIQPQGNAGMEIGLGMASGTAVPTDGAFFRWSPAGAFQAVINYAGTETTQALTPPPVSNDVTLFDLVVVEDGVLFYINDELVADIDTPDAQAYPTSAGRQPVFCRSYTSNSSPAQAPVLSLGQIIVIQQDVSQNKSWQETVATIGRSCYQSPVTPFLQTTNHANSVNPVTATLTNTGASYTTLGGRYQFPATLGAATDYALFTYQVPTGYQLFVQNVRVSAMSIGAIGSAVTPTILDWSIGLNSSAVSLATTENPPTSWGARRIPIGMQSFALATPIGTTASDIGVSLATPFVVDGNRYFHVIAQIPVGAATSSQIIRGDVFIEGYFE